ncbi:MAG: UPF0179 family protein [Candidatus Thermoplasmatota archaeon]|nr:UPF0179 family protein [Candidatus Thermoplasmatota archaeon]
MTFVTLIGKKLAKNGNEFVYLGITKKCRGCKLKMVCSNLKTGRRYRITKVRDKHHDCSLYEGGVNAVEIEKLPIITAIKKDSAEGTTITFHEVECDNIGCENYRLCHPGVSNKKYKIVEVMEDVDCPLKYKLKKVALDD